MVGRYNESGNTAKHWKRDQLGKRPESDKTLQLLVGVCVCVWTKLNHGAVIRLRWPTVAASSHRENFCSFQEKMECLLLPLIKGGGSVQGNTEDPPATGAASWMVSQQRWGWGGRNDVDLKAITEGSVPQCPWAKPSPCLRHGTSFRKIKKRIYVTTQVNVLTFTIISNNIHPIRCNPEFYRQEDYVHFHMRRN